MNFSIDNLDFDNSNLAQAWTRWRQTMELLIQGPLAEKTEEQKCGYFLLNIGQRGRDVYNTWTISEEDKNKTKVLFDKFEAYCKPQKNIVLARYRFGKRSQQNGETIDDYVTELTRLAADCNYGTLKDELIRDRMILGCCNTQISERLLEEELGFKDAIKTARSIEISKKQISEMNFENTASHVDAIKRTQSTNGRGCLRCGSLHSRDSTCPALDRICSYCSKKGHYETVCFKKKNDSSRPRRDVHVVSSEVQAPQTNGEQTFFLWSIENNDLDEAMVDIAVNDRLLKFKIDTGAQVNVLPENIFKTLSPTPDLIPADSVILRGYGGTRLPILGKIVLPCFYKDKFIRADFFVIAADAKPVLGLNTCLQLNLIKLIFDVHKNYSTAEGMISDFADLFQGIGKFPGTYRIRLKDDAQPVTHGCREYPIAIRDRVKTTLDEMVANGILVKVDEPSQWVHLAHPVPKDDGSYRIVLDPRDLNKSICREHHYMPTLNDITWRLSGQKFFSVFDVRSSFWQIELDLESSLLTTFICPFGRFRYTRMPMGISSAQEVFQKRLQEIFHGLDGVYNLVDDVLVTGSSLEEHNERMLRMLERARQNGVKFNRDKTQLCSQSVKFFGEVISSDGLKPDPDKVTAIKAMQPPTSAKDLQCYLGMFTYLSQYCPRLSERTLILRQIVTDTNNGKPWNWLPEHDSAFKDIKDIITTSPGPVLAYFDSKKPVTLEVDASQYGLGASIIQDGKPVAYASKSLTPTQQKYAQIEKETLAIVFGCEKFHTYLFGREFTVTSDHKPLEVIMSKPLHAVPLRLQKMRVRLQSYNARVIYKPGKLIPVADTLSRQLGEINEISEKCDFEGCVEAVIADMPISNNILGRIEAATRADSEMQELLRIITAGWPNKQEELPNSCVRDFWNYRDEMTVCGDLIMKNDRILIPKSMRPEVLNKLHSGHFGIEKTQQNARQSIFWPRINADIVNMVSTCWTCQTHRSAQQKEPMMSHAIPERPWQNTASDIFHLDGKNYLILVDYFSRYFEIQQLHSTTASAVINSLKSFFSRHGICEKLVSDNGPQYSCAAFAAFAKEWGFLHVTSSPTYPQSNGLAERTVRVAKEMLVKTAESKQDFYLALLNYRTSPVDGHASPAQLLMSRKLRTPLPTSNASLTPCVVDLETTRCVREQQQERQQHYYNHSAKPLASLRVGDNVRMRKEKTWVPATVLSETDEPRSYVVRTHEGGEYRRNRRDILQQPPVANADTNFRENNNEPVLRRSSRVVAEPNRLTYFEKGFNGY